MKLHTRKKLVLNTETLRALSVKTAIKARAPSNDPKMCVLPDRKFLLEETP